MSAHTPGPWRVKRTNDGRCDGIVPDYHNHDGDDCYDYEREGFKTCPATMEIVTTDSGVYGPQLADAHLIAAAPDLLAALDDLWLWATEQRIFLGSDPMPEGLSERCEAAIAKAEGQ